MDSSAATLLHHVDCPSLADLVDFLDQLVADWAAAEESRSLALAKASVLSCCHCWSCATAWLGASWQCVMHRTPMDTMH